MSFKPTDFYKEAHRGRTQIWIWIAGIVCLFFLTFSFVSFMYSSLSKLAQVIMSPTLSQMAGHVGYWKSPFIVFGAELFYWTVSCSALAASIWIMGKLRLRPIKRLITTAAAFRFKRFWAGCAVYAGIYACYLMVFVAYALIQPETALLTDTDLLKRLNIKSVDPKQAFWVALPLVLLFTPINAALQEIVFRGFIDQGMVKFIPNKFVAFILAGIIFAAWHYGSPGQYYGWFGFYMGFVIFAVCMSLIVNHDQGLEAAIGVHTANNILAISFWGSPYDGFSAIYWFEDLNPPNYGMLSIFSDIALYGGCLLLLVFWKFGLETK